MPKSPLFSIVMPHYYHSIPYHRFVQAVSSVASQSYPLWELLIYHDGPLADDQTVNFVTALQDPRIRFQATATRHNDWGHSLRNIGITEAKGDYIVHMNSDNVLYTHCLAILAAYSLRQKQVIHADVPDLDGGRLAINPDLLIFGIKMMGVFNALNHPGFFRIKGQEESLQLALSGWPPNKYKIDAMQLVAKRALWLDAGGWNDKTEESDGNIIEILTKKHGYLVVPEILGEHW